ncbi:hypothetical protein RJ639_044215 [Escallonia herrerae]|uniref:Protein kinase domain-containing protein n=1 Tax=Escallonia herrerae TaxID=1293975 RepID=A0AA88WBI2_9ASTE|nr:hypothetical protein RJ639_044215 [Escallonia herrerae]
MSRDPQQRVLVVQDMSREAFCTEAITCSLHELSLLPGDKITHLTIILPFRTAESSAVMGCGMLRYKSRLNSSATIKKKQDSINREISEKLAEYEDNAQIRRIRLLKEMQEVDLETIVEAAHSPKEITVQAAKNLDATCVILDREMKKYGKYFMDNLSCGIYRMKRKGGLQRIREIKVTNRGDSIHNNLAGSTSEQQEVILEEPVCSICGNTRPGLEALRKFSYTELCHSTYGFHDQNLLSQHGRKIYRGVINGQKIVVRKHTLETIKDKEFKSRVEMLGKARHENVAMLLGSCSEKYNRYLVYEYACNDTLNMHLSSLEKSTELTWERRMKIAVGAAKGLEYLHRIGIYGSVRPNNILLTHDYHVRLANFGITTNQYEDSGYTSDSRVMKTFEYLAPEYEEAEKDLSKADVFSFGVVLLELITGRKTLQETHGQSFLRWARPFLRVKRYHDLIDPAVLNEHNLHELFWMVRLVEKCVNYDPDKRPNIEMVRFYPTIFFVVPQKMISSLFFMV